MDDLLAALCLVMVIEGILPFLSPRTWRAMTSQMAAADDRALRIAGLASMVIGAGLLHLIH